MTHFVDSFTPGPPNESNQHLHFALDPTNHPELFAALPAIDINNGLTFTPRPNASGIALLTVTVQDDGGTDDGGSDTSTFTFPIAISKLHSWHNAQLDVDVDGDHTLAARDALLVINYLNALGSFNGGKVPQPGMMLPDGQLLRPGTPFGFVDVNGDGFIAPNDVVLVINGVNARAGTAAGAEGEQTGEIGQETDDDSLLALLAADVVEQGRRKR